MDERLATLLADLERAKELAGAELHRAARRAAWLGEFTTAQLAEFLTAVAALPLPPSPAADRLLANWLLGAVRARRAATRVPQVKASDDSQVLPPLEGLYRGLAGASAARGQLLAWLATGGSAAELALLGGLLLEDPPQGDEEVVQALAPLFQRQRTQAALLFPRLLHAMTSPALAAPVLDLANFLTREKIVVQHPASEVAEELVNLLGELVQTLLTLEERPTE